MKNIEEVTIIHVMLNYKREVSFGGLNSLLGGRDQVFLLSIISLQITIFNLFQGNVQFVKNVMQSCEKKRGAGIGHASDKIIKYI